LINELRPNPADCFVLHDLSAETRDGLAARLKRFDAVIVLEPSAFSGGFIAAAPGLNRAASYVDDIVAADPELVRLDDLPVDDLPPMKVYRRHRENSHAPPAPAEQISRVGQPMPSTVR
jgi:hypothetical protein